MNRILVVDDEKNIREALRMLLEDEYEVALAASGREALGMIEENPGLVILDVRLPDMGGLEVLRRIRELNPNLPVIMLSGVGEVGTVVEAMRAGAVDYLPKPFDSKVLRVAVEKMFAFRDMSEEMAWLQSLTEDYRRPVFIGRGPAAERLRADVARFAGTGSSVLIGGESGVGKEVVARLIHFQGSRGNKPFIPVHCAAVPENLFESELFGHEKGAFTDATARKEGLFDLARDGTIFLDEVGEMPLATQVKLLRVLQEREYLRLGGTRMIKTGARVLAATARDLETAVARGEFRGDLYYRLNVLNIRVPPLRERPEDIPDLAEYFFRDLRRRLGVRAGSFGPGVLERLAAHSWPGNVRELKNIIERLLVLHGAAKTIGAEELAACLPAPAAEDGPGPGETAGDESLEEALRRQEERLIRAALKKSGGVKSEAARTLKTTRRILSYRMQRLGIGGDGTS